MCHLTCIDYLIKKTENQNDSEYRYKCHQNNLALYKQEWVQILAGEANIDQDDETNNCMPATYTETSRKDIPNKISE